MLEDNDCLLIEETLAATVSSFVIRYHFGNVEPAACLQFQRTDRSDKKAALEILGKTADRGVAVSQKAWREASGVAAPDEGEAVIEKAQAPALPPDSAFGANDAESDIDELSRALSTEKKQELLAELDRIEAMDDISQRADALANLQRNIGNYFDGGDAEAEAMMKILERRILNEK